jgi:hypothetical protein
LWQPPSGRYGCQGEKWDRSRLPIDWSYAGYGAGEKQIPLKPQSVDARAAGAKGDGRTDDTAAVERAIAQARDGTAVYFPPGADETHGAAGPNGGPLVDSNVIKTQRAKATRGLIMLRG